jgi:hypothetical protein
MSLPVGTLVMLVRPIDPKDAGLVGEIVAPLSVRDVAVLGPIPCYGVVFPRDLSDWPGTPDFPAGAWGVRPSMIIPITPPGRTDDVTTDEPVKEAA